MPGAGTRSGAGAVAPSRSDGSPAGATDGLSGAELARLTRRRQTRAVVVANGLGGLAVFALGILSPGSPGPGDVTRMALINGAAFLVLVGIAFPVGIRGGLRLGAPLERFLREERPATAEEQRLALTFPARGTLLSVKIWAVAAVYFGIVNGAYSVELGVSAFVVTVLGGATCCALVYLLTERNARPTVARALAGRAPPRTRGPSVAARLTIAWTLVTGVPLVGIAAVVIADLVGIEIDTLATVSTLFLALVGLLVGFAATTITARSVGDPIRTVQEAMESVERGEFGTRVSVDDGSEVGQLQAGFNRMASGLAEREKLRDLFGRHVGEDVAKAALDDELRLGGEERDVAVLFVDLVGSTKLAADRPPTEVVALLNSFFELIVETVEGHEGWVNKFEGDAALCVFGAPTASEDPAGCALAAARELRERLAAGLPELDAGIGVSAGRAVAGNVGAERRLEYTVIGDPVNEAARLCELAKRRPERVLASSAALERADETEGDRWELGDEVQLRGRAAATRLATPELSVTP